MLIDRDIWSYIISIRVVRVGFTCWVVLCVAAAVTAVGVVAPVPVSGQAADVLCDPGDGVQFSDVDGGDYGAGYILCARALGLTTGQGDGTFGADKTLTRAQMAAFLARLWRDVLGRACPSGSHPFKDVPKGHFAAADIACIYGLKITRGAGPDTYAPEASLSASQLTRFVIRTLNAASAGTCDTSGNELSKAAACMVKLNIAPNQTEAKSDDPAIRAQMAVYIIGAWHHASNRNGQPPKPPTRPDTTTTTTTTTTTVPGSGAPSAPVAPKLTSLSSGNEVRQIRIEWTPPSSNGNPVTRYWIHYIRGKTFPNHRDAYIHGCDGEALGQPCYAVRSVPGTDTSLTVDVSQSTEDTVRSVRLAACSDSSRTPDSQRCSGYSPVAEVVVPASVAPAKPAPPVLTPGNGEIRVDWTAPSDNGYTITGYDVTLQGVVGPPWPYRSVTVSGSVTGAVITGLTNGTAYKARVQPKNAAVRGPMSDWSSPATPEAPSAPPAAPAAPTLTTGHGAIHASWSAPADNGSPITQYALVFRPASGGSYTTITFSGSATSGSILGITGGTTYHVWLRARNVNGLGPYSPAASATPTSAAPAAPDAPTLTAGNGRIQVSWSAPASNGSPITHYQLFYTPAVSGLLQYIDFAGSVTSGWILGIPNGTTRYVYVRAKNANGFGPWSPYAAATPSAGS